MGVPDEKTSRARENRIVSWLEKAARDATEIYLLGDQFDFWFEYRDVVPKGFVRFQGCLARIADAGIPVNLFTGNHDMWMFGYLKNELGVELFYEPITRVYDDKKFYLGHGDGLGPGDTGYKFIKSVFANRLCQIGFAALPPAWGFGLSRFFSSKSRKANYGADKNFLGEGKEWLIQHCRTMLTQEHFDYFIFGHRHFPLVYDLGNDSRYVNLGDWITHNTYAHFDGNEILLNSFTDN